MDAQQREISDAFTKYSLPVPIGISEKRQSVRITKFAEGFKSSRCMDAQQREISDAFTK
jgi:hypothetical protein